MKIIPLFIIIMFISGCVTNETLTDGHEATQRHLEEHSQVEEVHIHVGFKVFINDKPINFSVPMYQLQDKYVHVEHGIGGVVHVHKAGITIGDFFETLGLEFSRTCIKIPIEGTYCSNNKLIFYVNGVENNEFENYEIQNLDKILVSYGAGDIDQQLNTVTDLAVKG